MNAHAQLPNSSTLNNLVIAVAVVLAAQAPTAAFAGKIAVTPLRAGAGATEEMARALGDVVVSELRRLNQVEVITRDEIAAILDHEGRRTLLGCDDVNCYADLGGALGADELLAGSVAKLGTSWLFHLQRIDVRAVKVVLQVDRRLKGSTLDDMLDVIPGMVQELLSKAPIASKPAPAPATAGVTDKPASYRETPLRTPEDRKGLVLFKNPRGQYVAINPSLFNRSPVFYGDGKKMFKQVTISSGRSGNERYSITVWDPRYADGYQRQLSYHDGITDYQCGEDTFALKPLDAATSETLLSKAAFFEPRWTRTIVALAADDGGRYFVVDKAREPKDNRDFRLYVGAKGSVRFVPVTDQIQAANRQSYLTAAGQLVYETKAGEPTATWTASGQSSTLRVLSVYEHARAVYADLGVYETATLGTFCDTQ